MKLRVRVGVSQWAWGDGDSSHVLPGGVHDLPNDDVTLSSDFVKAIGASAHADSSAIEVLSADEAAKKLLGALVESDAQSRKALAKAMGSFDAAEERWTGPWYEGHLQSLVDSHEAALAEAKDAGDEQAAEAAKIRLAQTKEKLAALGDSA